MCQTAPQRALDFADLFTPQDNSPAWTENSTQQALRALTEDISGPFIALVELPTGVGKTEAALQVYARRARRKAQGLYFALLTMATTNAMFSRQTGRRAPLSGSTPAVNAGCWLNTPWVP